MTGIISLLALVAVEFVIQASGQDFGYDGIEGPSHWGEKYHQCVGKHQSPINIEEHNVQTVPLLPMMYENFDKHVNLSIMNNGHTVQFRLNSDEELSITGGPLIGKYVFAQMHFHWGDNDLEGSENRINNNSFQSNRVLCKQCIICTKRKDFKPSKYSRLCSEHFVPEDFVISYGRKYLPQNAIQSIFNFPAHLRKIPCNSRSQRLKITDAPSKELLNFPMELHMVFYSASYGSVQAATEHSDGLCVLSFFYSKQYEVNDNYSAIVSTLPDVKEVGSTADLPELLAIEDIIAKDKSTYFFYSGSLTTPPCSEVVTWIEYKNTIFLAHEQMEMFRHLKSSHGELMHNFRTPQPLHGRVIRMNRDVSYKSVSIRNRSHLLVSVILLTILTII